MLGLYEPRVVKKKKFFVSFFNDYDKSVMCVYPFFKYFMQFIQLKDLNLF